MQCLQRIDQHAGDIAAPAQHTQAIRVHVFQGVGFAGRQRIADAGLHVAPPAMIGAAEADQMSSPGVVAREPHRLHDGFGARHVKGYLFQSGNLQQAPHVVGGHRMVGAQHRSQAANQLAAAFDALLVEVVAEHVDPVGAGQIVRPIAVKVGHRHPGGGLEKSARREVPAHEAAELKRHAVAGSELQIGDAAGDFAGELGRLAKALGKQGGQPHEARAARGRNVVGSRIDAEEERFAVLVERHQRCEAARHARMPAQRAMLGTRELQPHLQLVQHHDEREAAQRKQEYGNGRSPRIESLGGELYCRRMTVR